MTADAKKIKPIAIFISFALFCFLLYLPILENRQAQKTLALLVMAAVLWISEAIPLALTSLLIPVIAAFLQLVSTKEAFVEFSNPIIFLFMGGFVLAGSLSKHALDKLLAQKLVHLARGNFYWSSVLLMLATSFFACWVSNTSSAAMMIPLGLGLLVIGEKNTISPESKFLMLGIAYAANIGGIITMVATPPNAIGGAILGLSFFEWMMYGLPVFIITFPVMVIVLTLYFKPDKQLNIGTIVVQYEKKAPNKTLIAIFLFTVIL